MAKDKIDGYKPGMLGEMLINSIFENSATNDLLEIRKILNNVIKKRIRKREIIKWHTTTLQQKK